jgi:CDP-glucose 4,6-dehydratase
MNIESLRSGRVFLTGHTGFKGTWLTLLLERMGVEVVGFSLSPKEDSLYAKLDRKGRISEIFGDIRDLDLLNKAISDTSPKYVLHLAAQALVINSYKDPLDTMMTNVLGTANLLEACRKQPGIKSIGIVTTDKVYENNGTGKAFVESDPLGADDPYSASKVGAESVVRAWQKIYASEGEAHVLSLRAGNVIGGGDLAQHRLLPDIIRAKLGSNELLVRYPDSSRPWQHALDPLIGYLCALTTTFIESRDFPKAFNFGPDTPSLRVREVVEIAQQHYSGNLIVKFDSEEPLQYEAALLDLNSKLAEQVLGWQPVWNQEKAILSTLDWWDKVHSRVASPLEACLEDIDYALSRWEEKKF